MVYCTGRFNYPVIAFKQNLFRLVPIAILLSTLQVRPMMSIQVLEDPVLVF
jgi:hypothetical protein